VRRGSERGKPERRRWSVRSGSTTSPYRWLSSDSSADAPPFDLNAKLEDASWECKAFAWRQPREDLNALLNHLYEDHKRRERPTKRDGVRDEKLESPRGYVREGMSRL
jgi:hypothetical protein